MKRYAHRRRFALVGVAPFLVAASALAGDGTVIDEIALVPPSDAFPESMAHMEAYADQPEWGIAVVRRGLTPQAVTVTVPDPFGGSGPAGSVLPATPQSSIYRFKYLPIASRTRPPIPFRYLEIDWNTEGQPRGPSGAFLNPHYDFHFYLKDQWEIDEDLVCVTIGKTCDPASTGYAGLRPFLDLPAPRFLPPTYFTDTGSPIAAMGLHNLDAGFEYTVENVNHNAVIIYGTFGGELVFLEASLTLFAFQDAMALPRGEKLSWQVPQPSSYAFAWWPTQMSLGYDRNSGNFTFALEGFDVRHRVPRRSWREAREAHR